MRKLIYSMGVSLERLHRRARRRDRLVGARRGAAPVPQRADAGARGGAVRKAALRGDALLGDREETNPSAGEPELEFARIWRDLPKIVSSTTLAKVEGNARLASGGVAEEVARLKEEPGKDLAVGGAGLASACIELGLVDEYRLFVSPVVLGGGTPYFPALDARINLELVETRTFGSRVVYVRYRRDQARGG